MKNIRFFWTIGVLGSLAVSLTTCGSSPSSPLTLVAISVTPLISSIPLGFPQQFTATGKFSNGTSQDITTQVTWNSSNTSVLTVNGGGLATPVSLGTATITASLGGLSESTTYVVTSATLSSIFVTPVNLSLPRGVTQQFTATGIFSDNTNHDITTQATWNSSDPSIATVNNIGLVTGVATGTATLTATFETISGSTTLTVTSAALLSIAVTPANLSIPRGTTQQFTATGTYADGTTRDITTQVIWSSSFTIVLTVNSSSGLGTAIAAGTTAITATSGTISGSTALTVT